MSTRVIHLRLKDWALVACLEYIKDKTSVADAVRRTLEAFVLAMQSQGKLPKRTKIEIRDILVENKILEPPTPEIDLEGVADFLDQTEEERTSEDIAEIARRVEQEIEGASVPDIRQSEVVVKEIVEESRPVAKLNLFSQDRVPIKQLRLLAPKDRFIEQAMIAIAGQKAPMTRAQEIFTAALEIAYSNLSRDLWGSERAYEQIKGLIAAHQEEDT